MPIRITKTCPHCGKSMEMHYDWEGERHWSCENCGLRGPKIMTDEEPPLPDILPCPFCDVKPECALRSDGWYQVCCNECGAEGPFSKEQEQAIENWNAALPRLKALFS